jgi:hypothetical protein
LAFGVTWSEDGRRRGREHVHGRQRERQTKGRPPTWDDWRRGSAARELLLLELLLERERGSTKRNEKKGRRERVLLHGMVDCPLLIFPLA